MKQDDIRLVPISSGTVIDHLPVGTAQRIVKILGLEKPENAITLAINTESKTLGRKDLIFIEGKELSSEEIGKIGFLAEGATLNIISNSEVKKKVKIAMPDQADGLIKCMNPKCVSVIENLPSKFKISKKPLKAKCRYCEKEMGEKEIFDAIE